MLSGFLRVTDKDSLQSIHEQSLRLLEKAGKLDPLKQASKKCNHILKETQKMLMPADVDQEISHYLNRNDH